MSADGRRAESLRTYHTVRTSHRLVFATLVLTAWLSVTDCVAQTSGGTLWTFLGIPTNAADQASSNPAIAAAAKAKAAKHEICKKKKAIAYLAGMGCSTEHPEVAAALLAAMGDPEEPVRYEAVKAVLQTAEACQSNEQKRASKKALSLGEQCHEYKKKLDKAICDCIDRLCGKAPPKEHKHSLKSLFGRDDCPQEPEDCGKGKGSCCTPEIREKLQQLAHGRDERGCFLEKSSRVRELAAAALEACAACGGCGCHDGDTGADGLRETPPDEAREMGADPADRLLDGDCVYESVVVPLPEHMQPTPADPLPPEPAAPPHPSGLGFPPPEPIPAPSASLQKASSRLALVPGAGPLPPGALLPPRPAPRTPPRPSEIWSPTGPARMLARPLPLPARPVTAPPADLDTVRRSLGTLRVADAMSLLPGPLAVAPPSQPAIQRPAPPESISAVPTSAPAPTPWLLRGLAIVLTIAASLAAVAGGSEWRRDRHD